MGRVLRGWRTGISQLFEMVGRMKSYHSRRIGENDDQIAAVLPICLGGTASTVSRLEAGIISTKRQYSGLQDLKYV